MKLVFAALLGLLLCLVGCSDVECAGGTVERGGVCVAADDESGAPVTCAEGEHYEASLLQCIPDAPPGTCAEGTEAVVNEDGSVECRPVPGEPCAMVCKNPDLGKVTICGRLVGLPDGLDVDAGTGTLCDPDNPTADGVCSIGIQAFDALQFAANPTAAPPLYPDELLLNDCGFYTVHNLPTPMLGFLAVAIDDHPASGTDRWAKSGAAHAIVSGQRIVGATSIVISNATDAAWTAVAGDPFGGMTFSERGTYLPIFVTGRADDIRPVAGVKVTANGSVEPTKDFYFTDAEPFTYTTLSATQDATGANGAALLVDTDLVNHGGTGAEPTDTAPGQLGVPCVWPVGLGDAIPGAFFAFYQHAKNSNTGENCE